MIRSSLAAACAALLLPAVASAAPQIKELEIAGQVINEAPPGGYVLIKGSGFVNRVLEKEDNIFQQGVEVTFKGTEFPLLAVHPEYVTVRIPADVKPAKGKLVVKTKDGKVETAFAVLEAKAWEDKYKDQEGSSEGGGGAQDVENEVLDSFSYSRFEFVENRFELAGSASLLPDRFSLTILLQYNGDTFDSRRVSVEGGKWKATFGPYTKKVFYGAYEADLVFELSKQSRSIARKFLRGVNEKKREALSRVQRHNVLVVGTQQEIADQTQQIQQEYMKLATKVEELWAVFERGFAGAAKVFYKQPGRSQVEQDKYLAYLLKAGLAKDEKEADKISRDTEFAYANGNLKPKEYQTWVVDKLFTPMAEAYNEHQTFLNGYICKLDNANSHSDQCVSSFLGTVREWSLRLYKEAKLAFPGDELRPTISPVNAPENSRNYFQSQKRLLMLRLGMQPPGE
ncbi:MAG: hypothetical protein KDD82_30555 [Planctomycetes bacterium]|nr:hypothetical protein [Planctomycetota bacterium]